MNACAICKQYRATIFPYPFSFSSGTVAKFPSTILLFGFRIFLDFPLKRQIDQFNGILPTEENTVT